MMRRSLWVCALLLAGCGTQGPVCSAGAVRACLGPASCSGQQLCLADGTGFGGCDCSARSDGGTDDAGTDDAGALDAGDTDAGTEDAGVSDAGDSDAGLDDAGTPDAGTPDAGVEDAGVDDAGTPDAGSDPDAGVDAGP